MSLYNEIYGSKYYSVADLQATRPLQWQGRRRKSQGQDGTSSSHHRLFRRCREAARLEPDQRQEVGGGVRKIRKWVGVVVDLYDEDTSLGKGVRLRPVKTAADAKAAKDMNDQVLF